MPCELIARLDLSPFAGILHSFLQQGNGKSLCRVPLHTARRHDVRTHRALEPGSSRGEGPRAGLPPQHVRRQHRRRDRCDTRPAPPSRQSSADIDILGQIPSQPSRVATAAVQRRPSEPGGPSAVVSQLSARHRRRDPTPSVCAGNRGGLDRPNRNAPRPTTTLTPPLHTKKKQPR